MLAASIDWSNLKLTTSLDDAAMAMPPGAFGAATQSVQRASQARWSLFAMAAALVDRSAVAPEPLPCLPRPMEALVTVEASMAAPALRLSVGVVPERPRYTTFPEELRGRHVVHWVDNESAVYGLVKGYSGSPDSARVINLYHACITQLGVTPWVEYVHTDDNLADDPSRGEFSLLLVLGGSGSYRAAVVPPVRSLTGPLLPLLAAAPPL